MSSFPKGDQSPAAHTSPISYPLVQSNVELEQEMYTIDGFSSIGVNGGTAPANPADMDADPAALLRLGKKQVPKASDFN